MKEAFDLGALQESLKKFPEYKDLNKKIRLYISAKSFRLDLESAVSSLNTLSVINASDGESRQRLGQPLMTHAVMMYCRAAIEDGSGRHPMGVTKNFSDAQKRRHQDVVKLRNKTMAHFGVGEGAYGQIWIKEVPVMRVVDGNAQITDVWVRANYIAQLIFDLGDLCRTALETVVAKSAERQKDLADTLFQALQRDRRLAEMVRSHPFDPAQFYDSSLSEESFWRGAATVHEVYTPKMTTTESSVAVGPPRATLL